MTGMKWLAVTTAASSCPRDDKKKRCQISESQKKLKKKKKKCAITSLCNHIRVSFSDSIRPIPISHLIVSTPFRLNRKQNITAFSELNKYFPRSVVSSFFSIFF